MESYVIIQIKVFVFLQLSATIRMMFRSFDADKDGFLDQNELSRAFASMVRFERKIFVAPYQSEQATAQGRRISSAELKIIVSQYDTDKNGLFDAVRRAAHMMRCPLATVSHE